MCQARWKEYPPPALQVSPLASTFLRDRARQAHFYPAGEVGTEAERGQIVKILFHSLVALLNLDTLTQDNSTRRCFFPLPMKSQGFVKCPDPILST